MNQIKMIQQYFKYLQNVCVLKIGKSWFNAGKLKNLWKKQKETRETVNNMSSPTELKNSFANIRLKMKNDKEDLSRKSVFLKTRSMKSGPSQEVKDIVDQMDRSLSHIPLDEQTEADKEKAFIDVMGHDKHGRVRTYGCGPTPTRLLQSSLSTSTATTSSNRIKEIVESELATRMAEYEAQRVNEIEDAIAVTIAQYEAQQAKENEATIAAQMKQILESIGLIVPAEILVQNSPGVRSSVGLVATTSTHSDEENHGDDEEERV